MGLHAMSSGEIFRKEIEAKTDLGRLAQRYIDHGELVPNGVTIEMMAKRLRDEDVRRSGFVLDGFPRTVRQASALDDILSEMGLVLDTVISIEVPEAVVLERLTGRMGCTRCGEIYHSKSKPPKREGLCDKCNSHLIVRSDDEPETIRERLKVFNEQTQPVVDYYANTGLLKRVDGTTDPEEIYKHIVGISV
jgi:adenylate kinase